MSSISLSSSCRDGRSRGGDVLPFPVCNRPTSKGRAVLVVRPVAPGGHRYYLAAVGPPGSSLGEVAGRWMGSAAPLLGASGEAGDPGLGRLLAGCDPVTGSPLVVRRAGRLAGLDVVVAAPKSLSVAAALA